MSQQTQLLLTLLALDAERVAQVLRHAGHLPDEALASAETRRHLEDAAGRMFAGLDLVIAHLALDHAGISERAIQESERFTSVMRPQIRRPG